jgi:hypothetical protein
MINSETITNYLGESITLELRFPEKSGFLVQGISGLGPSKAAINSTESATSDGSVYNSARVTMRNIVFTLKLLPHPDMETTRQLSYKYFPIKKLVTILIETDNRVCETYGYVESNEPNIFSNMETTQISILCPDPYFYSAGKKGYNVTVFSGIQPMLEFPFSNESASANLLEIGDIVKLSEKTVLYNGDAEIGVLIYIHALGEASNITIYNATTNETMKINTDRLLSLTGSSIVNGDDIIISTIKGQKSATLLREGIYTNILNCLDRDTSWFRLVKGDNLFAFASETGNTNLQFQVLNKIVYEGV